MDKSAPTPHPSPPPRTMIQYLTLADISALLSLNLNEHGVITDKLLLCHVATFSG